MFLLTILPAIAPVSAARGTGVSRTLVYGSTQEPDTLNPLLTQTAAGQLIDTAVFDSLLRVDAHNRLLPDLAVSWQHSADSKTWTFHLRHNAKFADGVDVTSTDVYWTYLSIINPNNQAASIQGWDLVDSMRTPDRFTLVMHLKQAQAPWLGEIGTTAILPKHALYQHPTILNQPFNRTPFGSGPYLVKAWQPGKQITLEANPYYWGGAPRLQRIIYRILPDDAQLLGALRTGAVQLGAVNAGQVPQAKRIPGHRVIATPGMTWYHVDLKQWGYLREQAVRQALDFATPKQALVHDILHGYGQVAMADIAPSLSPYFDPKLKGHPYNPLRAAKLLAADGFKPGPGSVLQRCTRHGVCTPLTLTLWSVSSDQFSTQVNARLAREWRAIGVGVTLRTATAAALFGPTGPQFSRAMTGITYGWTNSDDPDDRFYWNSAFIPASPSAGGGNDVAYFYRFSFQAAIDDLTNEGVLQLNIVKRRAIYQHIQSLLADQTPVIFLYWPDTLSLAPLRLLGFQPSPFTTPFWNVAQWRWA